jgi:hypothetical protein
MSLKPNLIIAGQTIDYNENLKYKLGTRKREFKTSITGLTRASESLDDSASKIMVTLDNSNRTARSLMESLYKQPFNRDGQGSIIASIVYSNDPNNPINFEGGILEDLPEIEDTGTTEYSFVFNSYSQTL